MKAKLFIIWEERQALREQLYVLLFETSWVLKKLNLDELQKCAHEYETCLILPASSCSIHQVHLPKVSVKDLPLAISALLEDKILGNYADFFSYHEKVSADDYLVFLWEKKTLESIQAFFQKYHIEYAAVTLDWFALKPREIFLMGDGSAYVYSDAVQGFLSKSVFKHWFQNYSFDALRMYASEAYHDDIGVTEVHESFWIWMAKRLSEMPIKDIFAKPKRFNVNTYIEPQKIISYFPRLLPVSIGVVLTVFLIFYSSNLFLIKKNQVRLHEIISISDDDIEFRLNRYIEKQKQKNQFWSLWTAVQSAKNSAITIDNIQFQQRKIKINLTTPNMQFYQQFKRQLSHADVRIVNSQLQTDARGIRFVLEIQGGF